jgi:hypothetical protein
VTRNGVKNLHLLLALHGLNDLSAVPLSLARQKHHDAKKLSPFLAQDNTQDNTHGNTQGNLLCFGISVGLCNWRPTPASLAG